jgi:hypothetical protein
MSRLLLVSALLAASIVPPVSPAAARGKPVHEDGVCMQDSSLTVCAYSSQNACLTAARAIRRDKPAYLGGCYLSTADPDYWHYGMWVLEYQL